MTNSKDLNKKMININSKTNYSNKNELNLQIMQLKLQSIKPTLLETNMTDIYDILK